MSLRRPIQLIPCRISVEQFSVPCSERSLVLCPWFLVRPLFLVPGALAGRGRETADQGRGTDEELRTRDQGLTPELSAYYTESKNAVGGWVGQVSRVAQAGQIGP